MIRDRKYLDYLRTMPCIVSGVRGDDYDAVDPVHIGTAGKGLKSPDDEALPIRHSIHLVCHTVGEMTTLRRLMPDWLLREALRAYARQEYRKWKNAKV